MPKQKTTAEISHKPFTDFCAPWLTPEGSVWVYAGYGDWRCVPVDSGAARHYRQVLREKLPPHRDREAERLRTWLARCGNRHKPKGRVYTCPACDSIAHRDVQDAANMLARFLYDELAKVPVVAPKYRRPAAYGKRSMRSSPGHGACSSEGAG